MAVADVLEDRVIIDEADATTGWTGSVAPTLFTADPDPVEATGCLGMVVSNTTQNAYFTLGAAVNLSAGVLLYMWVFHRAVLDTLVNGGLMFQLGDGTNRVGYHRGGADLAPFRHDVGPSGWMCMVLDTGKLASYSATVFAGTRAALEANLANITQIGVGFKTLAKATGGATNCFWDISRRGALVKANARGVRIVNGTTPDPAATFLKAAELDRAVTNQRAHGLVRELGTGVYGLQGEIRIGYASGAGDTTFQEKNVTAVFESRGLDTDQYRFLIQAGTGTTLFELGTKVGAGASATGKDGVAIVVPSGVGGLFDASGAGTLNVNIYGGRLVGFSLGVKMKSNHEFIDDVFANCGAVEPNGAMLVSSSVTDYSGATDTSAFIWNVATDPDGKLDGMSFTKGAGTTHAIEFGTTSPLTMTLRNVTFSGYNAANGQTDSALHIKRTTGTVTINVIGGTTPSYKTDGATVTIVANPVSATVKTVDTAGANIASVRVLVTAAAGGPFPFDVTVTITRTGSTATVAHTGHGLATNDKVQIVGANQQEYNGVWTITVTNANTYTYTVSGTPGTPATGTIKATFAVLSGLTDVNGEITMSRVFPSAQPVTGRARKASASPYYKSGGITGTVSASAGFSATVQMIGDE